MAIPFLSDIKLNGNQIKELVVDHKTSSNPTTGYHGQLIFRTDQNKVYINTSTTFNSPSWSSIAGDITSITAGAGMTTPDGSTGDVTINVVGGDGITANADEIEVTVDNSTLELSASNGSGAVKIKAGGVDTTQLAADAVTGAKIEDDAVDSEHIAAGAIDLAHMSANSIDSDQYVDGSIDTDHIADQQVTFAKMQQINALSFLGRQTGAGQVNNLSAGQARTVLNVEDGANNYSLDLTKLNTVTSGMTDADTLTFGDSGNDTQVTIKGNLTVIGTTTTNNVETVSTSSGVIFEGTAADGHDATLVSVVASSDKTYTLPNITGHIPILSNDPGTTAISATATELNYVDGVTSSIQTQLDGKQPTITGAATTIDDADLTASRALVSNGSGKVAVSAVTSTELGYLDGVTSAVQTQLNALEPAANKVTKLLSGSTDTSYDITHGFGTQHVRTTVLDYGDNGSSATYEQVFVDVKNSTNSNSSNNKITITFGVAPGTSQDYLVLVEKFPAIS